MNASIFEIRKTLPAARFALLAVCALALASCQTDGAGPTASDSPKAEATSTKPDDAAPRTQAAKPAEPVAAKPAEPAVEEPMTRTRAARECWMKTEKGNARENLDKRADLVNKCIDEKMKAAAGTPAPKT